MSTLYILCGISGSGKTTWAHENLVKGNIKYVSRDEIRFSMLKEGEDYFAHEKEVFKKFVSTVANALMNKSDAIADATHINEFSRRKFIQALDAYIDKYKIIYVVFNTDVAVCLERNKTREGLSCVPDAVIKNMCRDFKAPTYEEDERIWNIIHVKE